MQSDKVLWQAAQPVHGRREEEDGVRIYGGFFKPSAPRDELAKLLVFLKAHPESTMNKRLG